MGFRIRCAVSRVPLNAGDAVVAIPVREVPIECTDISEFKVCGVPVHGVMDGYGRVMSDGVPAATYEDAMIVHAGVNAALLSDPRLETTVLLRGKAEDLARFLQRAAQVWDPAILWLMVETALGHHGIPLILPKDPASENPSDHKQNLSFLSDVVRDVGWLGYAEDVFGVPLRNSVEDVTLLTQVEGLRIAEAVRDAVLAPSPVPRGIAL